MIITKELKSVDFSYDEAEKSFLIVNKEGGEAVELNKVQAFAFMRFIVRISQRNWLRHRPILDEGGEPLLNADGRPIKNLEIEEARIELDEDPSQLEMFDHQS